jgi:hypothetical protein
MKLVFSGFSFQLTEPNRTETSWPELVLVLIFKKIGLVIFLGETGLN